MLKPPPGATATWQDRPNCAAQPAGPPRQSPATAPALATLTKLQLLDPSLPTAIIGKAYDEVASLPWIQNWAQVGMVAVQGQNGDGIVQLNEFFMLDAAVVLATPDIAGLPCVISGLVAAGGMAAAMSTADGLLLAIANALSHDLYHKIIDPKADTRVRLIVARVILLLIGIAAALIASLHLTGILGAVAWAFWFACWGLFWPLVLGVWWKRANGPGAIAGMIAGFGIGSWYLYMVHDRNGVAATAYRLMAPWIGLDHLRFGFVGMAASLVAMVVVTLATRAPDAEITPGFLVEPMVPLFVAWFFLLFRFYLMPWLLGYSVRGMLSFPLESDIARALHALFSRGGG